MRSVILIFALVLLLLSCRQRSDERPAPFLSFTDDFAHSVGLSHYPARIVSLAPSITETLFALGLDSLVVGVTDYCDFPDEAKRKPKVGGMLNPNIERVVELQPDLVLMSASGNMQTDYQKLTDLGIPVFVSNPRTIDGVLKSITDVGSLAGHRAEAESLVARLRSQRASIARRGQSFPVRKVLVLLSLNPLIAAGDGTFLDELIATAHGENVARGTSTAYPVLSREEIFQRKPDVLIATNDLVRSAEAIITAYPEWRSLPAIQQKRITIVDASIVSRPGPRIIQGLEALVNALHGQLE